MATRPPLADKETEEGVRQRLANLGYLAVNANHCTDRELLEALRKFAKNAGVASPSNDSTEDRGEPRMSTREESMALVERYRAAIGDAAGG